MENGCGRMTFLIPSHDQEKGEIPPSDREWLFPALKQNLCVSFICLFVWLLYAP